LPTHQVDKAEFYFRKAEQFQKKSKNSGKKAEKV